MRIGYCIRGKHANKAKFLANSAEKFGFKACEFNKKSKDNCDIVISYGNFIPRVLPHQIFLNVHAGYLGRPEYHRISVGGYHPGEYIMDINHPSDRLNEHDITIRPWRRSGRYILVCTVSKFNMELFGLDSKDIDTTLEQIRRYTDREIIIRDRKERWGTPLVDLLQDAWAVVTWSSNCAVEALIEGVPCFLRTGAAASPLSLMDLSRLEDPYYPSNRQQWLQNLAYHQFHVHEIMNGLALETIMLSQFRRGVVIK